MENYRYETPENFIKMWTKISRRSIINFTKKKSIALKIVEHCRYDVKGQKIL